MCSDAEPDPSPPHLKRWEKKDENEIPSNKKMRIEQTIKQEVLAVIELIGIKIPDRGNDVYFSP